jgi:hypothetical protein
MPLLRMGTVATRPHNGHVAVLHILNTTVAMGLSWPVATVTIWHSSDGRPRCQRRVKLVAMGER